jgi:hypothetical protein
MYGTPPSSNYVFHPSGWIQTDLFAQWFCHFIQHVKPTEEDPALLGHYSHTTNSDIINLGTEHYVPIISLLLHSMHMMHPLDLSFMSPLKTLYMPATEQ